MNEIQKNIFYSPNTITITSIRHPFDRFISLYNYLLYRYSNNLLGDKDPPQRDFKISNFLKWDDVYIYKYFGKNVNQALNNIKNFNYIIRFQNIQEDMDRLIRREDLKIKININYGKKINASESLINSFTTNDIKLISDKLTDDIYFYREVIEHLKSRE